MDSHFHGNDIRSNEIADLSSNYPTKVYTNVSMTLFNSFFLIQKKVVLW